MRKETCKGNWVIGKTANTKVAGTRVQNVVPDTLRGERAGRASGGA